MFGSRFLSGRPHRVLYFWHSLGNRLLTLLSNMFTDLNLTDMETCYKVFRREVLDTITIEENRFGIEPEITAKVAQGRWRIYEVGISYAGRTYAEGKKIGWRDGMRALCASCGTPPSGAACAGQQWGVGCDRAATPRPDMVSAGRAPSTACVEHLQHTERRRVPGPRPGPHERGGTEPLASRPVGEHRGEGRRRGASSGASTPVTPSTTEQRWPLMSVATAGVPHAAPSVNDRPQPSASDALPTSHARRYSSRSCPARHVAEQRRPLPARRCSIHGSSSARSGPSPTIRTRRPGTVARA